MNPPAAFPYSGDLSPQERVEHYDEIGAAGGALGFVRGKELMYLILNHLDRAKLHGMEMRALTALSTKTASSAELLKVIFETRSV